MEYVGTPPRKFPRSMLNGRLAAKISSVAPGAPTTATLSTTVNLD